MAASGARDSAYMQQQQQQQQLPPDSSSKDPADAPASDHLSPDTAPAADADLVTTTGAPGDAQQQQQHTLLDSLTEDGLPDIYAYAVTCIVKGAGLWPEAKAVVAMLFTFALQMGLLLLLWEGLIQGPHTQICAAESQTDKLWRQVGQVQKQVCWLNRHAARNTSVPADAAVPCSGAWDRADCGADVRDVQEAREWSGKEKPLKECVQLLWGCRPSGLPETPEMRQRCEAFVEQLDSSVVAFATGLLHPECPVSDNTTWALSQGEWTGRSSSSSAARTALSAVAGGGAGGERGGEGVDGSQQQLRGIHQACMRALPTPAVLDASYVNLLAFVALVIFVHEEVRKAAWLGHVAAAYTGFLPAFFSTDQSRSVVYPFCGQPAISVCAAMAVVLLAPLMQLLTALMVLVASLALTFDCETQTSAAIIILSNVALSFVLDLDNRVGATLTAQHFAVEVTHHGQGGAAAGITSGTRPSAEPIALHQHSRVFGHVYLGIVGALLLAELVLLSPLFVWPVYARLKSSDTAFYQYWFKHGSIIDRLAYATLLGLANDMSVPLASLQDDPSWFWQMRKFSIVCMFTMGDVVFLLFGNILPVVTAPRWGPVLLALQMLLAMLSTVYLFDASLYLVPCVWLCAWLGLFVLWPLLHKPREGAARKVGRGGCESC